MKLLKQKLENSFLKKTQRKDNDKCWPWKACVDQNGYGCMWNCILKKRSRVTRVILFLYKNVPFESKLIACHKCDNPICVNPSHIFVGTMKDNSQDMVKKGRYNPANKPKGSKHFASKLSEADVLKIRNMYRTGEHTYGSIAQLYNIDKTVIGKIIKKTAWKHV